MLDSQYKMNVPVIKSVYNVNNEGSISMFFNTCVHINIALKGYNIMLNIILILWTKLFKNNNCSIQIKYD